MALGLLEGTIPGSDDQHGIAARLPRRRAAIDAGPDRSVRR
jgi:hypothetical protein